MIETLSHAPAFFSRLPIKLRGGKTAKRRCSIIGSFLQFGAQGVDSFFHSRLLPKSRFSLSSFCEFCVQDVLTLIPPQCTDKGQNTHQIPLFVHSHFKNPNKPNSSTAYP